MVEKEKNLKKLATLTKAMSLAGVLIILSSIVWHMFYPDISQMGITIVLGVYCLGFAYLCEWTRKMKESHDEIEQAISSMDLWIKEEFKKYSKK